MIYKYLKKIAFVCLCILILIVSAWLYLGGNSYFSVFDFGYYTEKFGCQTDNQCVVRGWQSDVCVNRDYNGGAQPGLQQNIINTEISCQCVIHHCMKK